MMIFMGITGIRKCAIKGNDSWVYFEAARDIHTKVNLYEKQYSARPDGSSLRPYYYPPVFSVLMIPLAALGNFYGGIVWGLLNVTLFFIVIIMCVKICTPFKAVANRTVFFLPIIICLRFIDNNNQNGQVNVIILFKHA